MLQIRGLIVRAGTRLESEIRASVETTSEIGDEIQKDIVLVLFHASWLPSVFHRCEYSWAPCIKIDLHHMNPAWSCIQGLGLPSPIHLALCFDSDLSPNVCIARFVQVPSLYSIDLTMWKGRRKYQTVATCRSRNFLCSAIKETEIKGTLHKATRN